jgi:hypothetical protein
MTRLFLRSLKLFIFGFLFFSGVSAYAQPSDTTAGISPGSDAPFEAGFHLGNLLPNQISGVEEIMALGGVRMGLRLAPLSYFEAGLISGNGEGVEWKNAHVDIRMDIPLENLLAVAYVGADAAYYKGVGQGNKLIFGGHAGGGIMGHVGGPTWFRGDMKFSFSPGTSLYIGVGLVFRLGAAGNS